MSEISHVIFDWNGTLLDDVHACVSAANTMLARRNLNTLTLDAYRSVFGFPVQNTYRTLGFDLERESWDDISNEFHALYQEAAVTATLRVGTREFLAHLMTLGIGRSILSASGETLLRDMMGKMGITDAFQGIYGLPDMHARSKAALGKTLFADLALDPATVVMLGDTLHDHEVAQELGCRCVLITNGHQSEERLRRTGRRVISQISDLKFEI